jgi:hypothetical protein
MMSCRITSPPRHARRLQTIDIAGTFALAFRTDSTRQTKKAPRGQGRRGAGSALGLGGKNQRAELLKLDPRKIVPLPRQFRQKKAPRREGRRGAAARPGWGARMSALTNLNTAAFALFRNSAIEAK